MLLIFYMLILNLLDMLFIIGFIYDWKVSIYIDIDNYRLFLTDLG